APAIGSWRSESFAPIGTVEAAFAVVDLRHRAGRVHLDRVRAGVLDRLREVGPALGPPGRGAGDDRVLRGRRRAIRPELHREVDRHRPPPPCAARAPCRGEASNAGATAAPRLAEKAPSGTRGPLPAWGRGPPPCVESAGAEGDTCLRPTHAARRRGARPPAVFRSRARERRLQRRAGEEDTRWRST